MHTLLSFPVVPALYFAYGSNLHADDFRRSCIERGLDPNTLRLISRAFLPDHQPVFDLRSSTRAGGTLDVTRRRGMTVAGALYEVLDDFAVLDANEGVDAGAYRRIETLALTEDGREHRCQTYVGTDERRGGHVAPTEAYLALVLEALRRHGHDGAAVRAAALGRRPACEPSTVFVYGTLRKGEPATDIMMRHDPFEEGRGIVRGNVRGRLVDLGEYPGLVLSDVATDRVSGEVYSYFELDAVLADLDEYEDFFGFGREDSLFRRALVRVDLDGRERLAWTYVHAGTATEAQVIVGGDWLAHRHGRDGGLEATR